METSSGLIIEERARVGGQMSEGGRVERGGLWHAADIH